MKTWSFIGSDKNAGKTTVLNYVHRRLLDTSGSGPICLTSIGINGEEVDNFEHLPKPRIPIFRGNWFITAAGQLSAFSGCYQPLRTFAPPRFRKEYLLGQAVSDFLPVLEGPNTADEILLVKEALAPTLKQGHLLIDGSIDRQFLGHPLISDAIFFALLISPRPEQQRKAADLLFALTIPECGVAEKSLILGHLGGESRSLLFDDRGELLYRGVTPPFLDAGLRDRCLQSRGKACLLYLNGALTRSLHALFAPWHTFRIVLDNFTLYQNVSVSEGMARAFRPQLSLLQPVLVRHIFLNQEADVVLALPPGIAVHNLFLEHDEFEL